MASPSGPPFGAIRSRRWRHGTPARASGAVAMSSGSPAKDSQRAAAGQRYVRQHAPRNAPPQDQVMEYDALEPSPRRVPMGGVPQEDDEEE
eukprot:13572852-Alexandrium_andersonii.AAC.1